MNYEKPIAEIIAFDAADIITASGDPVITDDKKDPYAVDNFS